MRRDLSIVLILPLLYFGICADAAELPKPKPALMDFEIEEQPQTSENSVTEAPKLPNIFIWQLPETDNNKTITPEDEDNDEISDEEEYDDDTYYVNVSKLPVKGYLEYIDESEAITLKRDENKKDFELDLSKPQKLKQATLFDKEKYIFKQDFSRNIYSKSGLEYSIAPIDAKSEVNHGNFLLGTSYNESIDTSDLGFTTSFYTKYENKYFALKSAYNKESGIDYSTNIDKFSITPELKLNRHISIKDELSSDITRNRKKNELILSIKPAKDDRVRFEFGANYTVDDTNSVVRSQVKFSTQYKW